MQENQLTPEKAQELWDKGYVYLNSGNEEEALRVFRELGEMGVLVAQFNLGAMYYNGQGTARDYQEALKWYRMAADKGLKEAQFSLGDMYENGTGVERDLGQALEWYSKAAEKGHARAYKKIVKIERLIDEQEEGMPFHVDTIEDIRLGGIYHDCGQPIFITQKGGVGMLSSIGGCLLTGELLRDVTFEGIDAMNKNNQDAVRSVLVAGQDGNCCSADILGFASMEGDVSIHQEAVSYSMFDYARLVIRPSADLSGWREPLELFLENTKTEEVPKSKISPTESVSMGKGEKAKASRKKLLWVLLAIAAVVLLLIALL